MSSLTVTSTQYSTPSINLSLTYILLTEWTLVRLQGKDIVQYLHNQFTCNIKILNKHQYYFSAHCNPQGKMISNMYVFYFNDEEIAFIQKKNICKKQIAIMKKYAVFSNITIIPDNTTTLIGVAGKQSRQYLNNFFSILPDTTHTVIHTKNAILLYFSQPIERFLLIIHNESMLHRMLHQSTFNLQIQKNYQWITLDIEAGYPWIESTTSEMFIPQAANMDILHGISFNKGCYIGQECITRTQYLGGNKRTLFRLMNTILNPERTKKILQPGEYLKLIINNTNEKYTGIVLKTTHIKKNYTWIQVILHKLVLKHSQQQLTIKTTQIDNNSFILSL